mmetsp:Transcript_1172/g.3981  ORF Transcript_1172/g.3981 Transcript_1172/m.3981 type:complete len:256 (+) Transcript_1172:187-954(+)
MQIFQAAKDVPERRAGRRLVDRFVGIRDQRRAQDGSAVDVLQDEVDPVALVVVDHFVERHDVRMVEALHDGDLTAHAHERVLLRAPARLEALERGLAHGLQGEELDLCWGPPLAELDRREGPAADEVQDLVVVDPPAAVGVDAYVRGEASPHRRSSRTERHDVLRGRRLEEELRPPAAPAAAVVLEGETPGRSGGRRRAVLCVEELDVVTAQKVLQLVARLPPVGRRALRRRTAGTLPHRASSLRDNRSVCPSCQ